MVKKLSQQDSIKLNTWVIGKLESLDWSMRELGRRTGVNISIMSKVLSGKQLRDWGFYFVLARSMDSVLEMLRVSNMLSKDDFYLLDMVGHLSEEEKKQMFDFVRFLSNKG